MKAEDLMIEDWVYNCIADIRFQVYPQFFSQWHNRLEQFEATIQPISLTPEILEKNGFGRSIDRSWGNDLREIYNLTYDVDVTHKDQIETFTHEIELQHHVSNGLWDVEVTNGSRILNLEYVHELQHALRLCRIEKEIYL